MSEDKTKLPDNWRSIGEASDALARTIYEPFGRFRPAIIYVIGCEGHAFIKIGTTQNLQVRLQQLGAASPWPLFTHYHVETQARYGPIVERYSHNILSPYRANGEWFECDPKVAEEAVKRACADLNERVGGRA